MTALTVSLIDKAYKGHSQQGQLSHFLGEQEKGRGIENDSERWKYIVVKHKARE